MEIRSWFFLSLIISLVSTNLYAQHSSQSIELAKGSVFTQMGSFSTDGSTRMGSTATGLGAVFNDRKNDRFGFDDDDDDKW